jgi:class 3 adenylate cyclase
MRRLRGLDLALFGTLVSLWVICFFLGVKSTLVPVQLSPVFATVPAAGAYPRVLRFRTYVDPPAYSIRPGDTLLTLDGADLRGVGTGMFSLRWMAGLGEVRELEIERAGERWTELVPGVPVRRFWPRLLTSVVFALTGIAMALRAPPSRSARSLVVGFLVVAVGQTCVFGGSWPEAIASAAVQTAAVGATAPFLVLAASLFGRGDRPLSLWELTVPWLFLVIGPLEASGALGLGLPVDIGGRGRFLAAGLAVLYGLAILARNYAAGDALLRRQMRWAILGMYLGTVPLVAGSLLAAYDPDLTWLFFISTWMPMIVPPFFLIAIARYNLLDIDSLISATAAYSILAVILMAGALTLVPRLADAASLTLGIPTAIGQIALSFGVASLAVPGRRRLEPWIERRFFPERGAQRDGFDRLIREVGAFESAPALTREVAEGVDALMSPESCVVYSVGADEIFEPVFARGRGVPPALDGRHPVIRLLRRRGEVLASANWAKLDTATLPESERAILETLDVAVLVPIGRGAELHAFLCLGPKRSWDVYTSTDLHLLKALAERVSAQFALFKDAELLEDGRVMREALRRYVPGAIAESLEQGREVELGESEVSVLFVDIRGYTSYSQSRSSREIFTAVSRYAEIVSEIVRLRGGTVVEFSGDGMMVVFGAPQAIPDKERSAIETAVELTRAVPTIPIERQGDTTEVLEVGVGIATGSAFVGNIRAVDRWIWSAIGNTTTLAARLQALTRQLDAAVVIDGPTWRAGADPALGFECIPQAPIRGRVEREDVYALPFVGSAPDRPADSRSKRALRSENLQ